MHCIYLLRLQNPHNQFLFESFTFPLVKVGCSKNKDDPSILRFTNPQEAFLTKTSCALLKFIGELKRIYALWNKDQKVSSFSFLRKEYLVAKTLSSFYFSIITNKQRLSGTLNSYLVLLETLLTNQSLRWIFQVSVPMCDGKIASHS